MTKNHIEKIEALMANLNETQKGIVRATINKNLDSNLCMETIAINKLKEMNLI